VLFGRRFLDGIADGSIDLAFRRRERPSVRVGTRQRTAVGVIEIDSVEVVAADEISDEDAKRAGHASLDDLLAALDRRGEERIYKVQLHWAGEDPRIALREQADLGKEALADLLGRLGRLDLASGHGAWTRQTLELIRDNPETRAADLAASVDRDTQPFKRDVRKLKELGLTESLERGYRLSPRGRALLKRLD
jgi:hypothetical protein